MITYTTGDILTADVDAVVNTVNTVGVMGKGLALQFKRRYPRNYEVYRAACQRHEVAIGKMFVTATGELTGPKWIINFPTKVHWRADSRLPDIAAGLEDLVRVIHDKGITSIAVPPLGAGNGNLDWALVKPVIDRALRSMDINVQVFEPAKVHRTIDAGETKMTPSRALIIQLIESYAARRNSLEPWEDSASASQLEIQKLMYFANLLQPGLRLQFSQGHYGPYSETVRIMLAAMEGAYLEGYGDGTDRALDFVPIRVTDRGRRELAAFAESSPDWAAVRATAVTVLRLVAGFEGPYPLELLSSVKWASANTGASDSEAVLRYIRSWNSRKGRIFTPEHVESALERLRTGETEYVES